MPRLGLRSILNRMYIDAVVQIVGKRVFRFVSPKYLSAFIGSQRSPADLRKPRDRGELRHLRFSGIVNETETSEEMRRVCSVGDPFIFTAMPG